MTLQMMTATIWRVVDDNPLLPTDDDGDTDAWDEIEHEFMTIVAHALDAVNCDVKMQDMWYKEDDDGC